MVQRLKINQFYGAPTAIRLLLKYGDQWVHKYDRSSLKTLGSGTPNIIFRNTIICTRDCFDPGLNSHSDGCLYFQQVIWAVWRSSVWNLAVRFLIATSWIAFISPYWLHWLLQRWKHEVPPLEPVFGLYILGCWTHMAVKHGGSFKGEFHFICTYSEV